MGVGVTRGRAEGSGEEEGCREDKGVADGRTAQCRLQEQN